MSFLRAGGAACLRAGRLTPSINARFVSYKAPPGEANVKTNPDEAPGTRHHGSTLISQQDPAQAMAHHQPDYDATIDHGTSYV